MDWKSSSCTIQPVRLAAPRSSALQWCQRSETLSTAVGPGVWGLFVAFNTLSDVQPSTHDALAT